MTVGRAGLLQDLGRLGVSNDVWDKPGPLTAAEFERVRLHPYLTERMLTSTPALASLASLAAHHHERLDGSGYPRGLRGDALSSGARILAAADVYRALVEPRPHRPAQSSAEAAVTARAEVKAGRLDGSAVEAVLRAAGHRARRRQTWPAGLTAREVEVLRLVARGLSHRADRRAARHLPQDGEQPRRADLRQDRRVEPGDGGAVRHAARPAARRPRRRVRLTLREVGVRAP